MTRATCLAGGPSAFCSRRISARSSTEMSRVAGTGARVHAAAVQGSVCFADHVTTAGPGGTFGLVNSRGHRNTDRDATAMAFSPSRRLT